MFWIWLLRTVIFLIGFVTLLLLTAIGFFAAYLIIFNPCTGGAPIAGANFYLVIAIIFLLAALIKGIVALGIITSLLGGKTLNKLVKQEETQQIQQVKQEKQTDSLDVLAIATYIHKSRKKGKGDSQIINSLQRAGWQANDIESAMRYLARA